MKRGLCEGIYVHIPFCRQKCHYCDFISYPGLTPELGDAYVRALAAEIAADRSALSASPTVFFGGGTPTVLSVRQLAAVVRALTEKGYWPDRGEKTIEANPETVDPAKLRDLRDLGFNRLSIGAQSFSDEELRAAGRKHSARQILAAVEAARAAGWQNINIDLISGLPGQTPASFARSLCAAEETGAEHLAVYALTVEEPTPLAAMIKRGEAALPPEEEEADMYDLTVDYLPARGYRRYEISNYARAGRECRHNELYWRYIPYRGFGAAAVSFEANLRRTNTFKIKEYLNDGPSPCEEIIRREDAMAEFIFLGLRRTDGIDPAHFADLFGLDIYDVYGGQLRENREKNWLTDDGRIKLTKEGMKFGNKVFLTFLPFLP
jgi:oxygen-independent coproporphyrinogen-3 oxidase